MIRSAKTSIKYANSGKQNDVVIILEEAKRICQHYVDMIWQMKNPPSLMPIEITNSIETWLSARMKQCIAKQASGVVRGTRQKQKRREYMIKLLNERGQYKSARKLQKVYDKAKVSKPEIKSFNLELDSRFVKINTENDTIFDGWVEITSIGNKKKIILPFKKTDTFNTWNKRGEIKTGVRLSEKYISFGFEISDIEQKNTGCTIGVDIGAKNAISCSNGFSSVPNKHGHDLTTISKRMSKKKKGSKGFKREQEHRKNYINWSIKQLNLSGVKQLNIENIKYLRVGKKSSRNLSHWTYAAIFDRLEMKCEEQGVLVNRVTPTYTSQRCSKCGWTRKRNRKGKMFRCDKCGFTFDSDLNAATNISLPLRGISKKQRLKRLNLDGFYWLLDGQEIIVPVVPKS